jgi:hypothetical protein
MLTVSYSSGTELFRTVPYSVLRTCTAALVCWPKPPPVIQKAPLLKPVILVWLVARGHLPERNRGYFIPERVRLTPYGVWSSAFHWKVPRGGICSFVFGDSAAVHHAMPNHPFPLNLLGISWRCRWALEPNSVARSVTPCRAPIGPARGQPSLCRAFQPTSLVDHAPVDIFTRAPIVLHPSPFSLPCQNRNASSARSNDTIFLDSVSAELQSGDDPSRYPVSCMFPRHDWRRRHLPDPMSS